jgi:hypothetical protein
MRRNKFQHIFMIMKITQEQFRQIAELFRLGNEGTAFAVSQSSKIKIVDGVSQAVVEELSPQQFLDKIRDSIQPAQTPSENDAQRMVQNAGIANSAASTGSNASTN